MDAEHVLTPKTGAGAPKEAAAHPVPATRHQGAERLRSLVLGPRGGGVTRRRASDAVRLGAAIVLVAICIALIRANTSLEIQLTKLLTPPPTGIRWLVSTLWQLGSFGVIAAIALLGLVVAGLATLGVCLLLSAVLGPTGGRPPVPQLPGVVTAFPVTQLAVAMAVALTGLPFLSRPMHRIVSIALTLAALSALIGGYGLPFNIAASILIGWGMAAACHLAVGSPAGLLSAAEVTEAVRDLRVDVRALAPVPGQEWGEQAFAGEDDQGRRLELAVYGRDASDAQWLTKLWRFLIYRDSGPTLMIHRLQQVEHE